MRILKFAFSLLFLALSVIWILFAIETVWPEIQLLANWDWFQVNIVQNINKTIVGKPENVSTGFYIVLISGAILLAYNAVMFLIQKIPLVGNFLRTITSFVSFISIVGIVIGSLLWAGIIV